MATSRSLGAASLTMRPPMLTVPRVISSRPAIVRRAVVLPHPDGPTKTMNSPSWISRSRSKTATVPSAKILVSLSRWISDMDPYLPFSGLGFRPPLPLLSPSYPAAITCKQKDAQHTIFSANLVLPGRVLSAPPTPPRCRGSPPFACTIQSVSTSSLHEEEGNGMSDEETPLYCSLCGDPVHGSAVFCAGCGAPVPDPIHIRTSSPPRRTIASSLLRHCAAYCALRSLL